MAGAKGKSGGARNGAGRPKKKPVLIDVSNSNDPKAFLAAVMNDSAVDVRLRMDAARTLMPYLYPKKGEGGKKEQSKEASARASQGRFAPSMPPKLIVNNHGV